MANLVPVRARLLQNQLCTHHFDSQRVTGGAWSQLIHLDKHRLPQITVGSRHACLPASYYKPRPTNIHSHKPLLLLLLKKPTNGTTTSTNCNRNATANLETRTPRLPRKHSRSRSPPRWCRGSAHSMLRWHSCLMRMMRCGDDDWEEISMRAGKRSEHRGENLAVVVVVARPRSLSLCVSVSALGFGSPRNRFSPSAPRSLYNPFFLSFCLSLSRSPLTLATLP